MCLSRNVTTLRRPCSVKVSVEEGFENISVPTFHKIAVLSHCPQRMNFAKICRRKKNENKNNAIQLLCLYVREAKTMSTNRTLHNRS